jgi:hypothetical protein
MSVEKMFGITDALVSLAPGAEWALNGDAYADLVWFSESISQPTEEDIATEIERLDAEHYALQYQRLRAAEYPDFKDYLDGIVKNDQAQIDAYIAACQAVKEKYPKPE